MVDLRSDTVTMPTDSMREAMTTAEVGDDVYEEDPSVNELEALTATMLGKQAALFTVSGTMGNLVSLLTHTHMLRAAEIISEASSHIFLNEVAGAATLGGIQIRPIQGTKGIMSISDISNAVRDENIHCPETKLICVENTHNEAGGVVQPLSYLGQLREFADSKSIQIHIDGARVFNAAVALGVDIKEISCYADSLSVCLSKGLSAPVGAMICGTDEFIRLARRYRKMLGGGMRQAGILAAAGIKALLEMPQRLIEDHQNARVIAEGLSELPGIVIDLSTVETNIIRYRFNQSGKGIEFRQAMAASGFIFNGNDSGGRIVTHVGVTEQHAKQLLTAAKQILH
ncbi:MAG: low-specificity L-threonine aldolase [Oscillospiraceae bacterium]|nr:low-specificity L-threonine aldolase [Oscillospiraceae bacterium]